MELRVGNDIMRLVPFLYVSASHTTHVGLHAFSCVHLLLVVIYLLLSRT